MGLKIFAEEFLATAAVEALAAEFGVVGHDAVADLETLDFRADRSNFADGLVARDQGKFGEEFAFVNVDVGAAYAAGFDFELYMIVRLPGAALLRSG
jgi:hypothetical protein